MKKNNQKLPISLKSFKIENYAGIIKTGLKDLPDDTQWIFLTGENGFGKTSVLQGISSGICKEEALHLVNSDSSIVLEVNYFDKVIKNVIPNEEQLKSTKLEFKGYWGPEKLKMYGGQASQSRFENFAAYGTSRLEIAHDTSSNEAAKKSSRLYSIFNSDGRLLSIEGEMRVWEKRQPTIYFSNLKRTLLKVLEGCIGDIFIEPENAKVMYVELDKVGNELPPVTFEKLASGYRSIVAMIGDLLIRFYKIYPRETPPEEFAGIVLIDELDVHLHPRMQKKIPGILSKVFPKMQFIASIHSPIPILGAPGNSVFLKVSRTKEEGVTVEKLDLIDVTGLTPNTLFSSPIFDFDEIINDNQDTETEGLVTKDHYTEAVFAEVLEKKLRKMAEDANIDPATILK